jgi:hypothetical protein
MTKITTIPRVSLTPQGPELSRFVYGTWRLADTDPALQTPLSILEKVKHCLSLGITSFDCVIFCYKLFIYFFCKKNKRCVKYM